MFNAVGSSISVRIGPFAENYYGTLKTDLTLPATDVWVSKNGGNFVRLSTLTAVTDFDKDPSLDGWYRLDLEAAIFDFPGLYTFYSYPDGYSPAAIDLVVVDPVVYDLLFTNTPNLASALGLILNNLDLPSSSLNSRFNDVDVTLSTIHDTLDTTNSNVLICKAAVDTTNLNVTNSTVALNNAIAGVSSKSDTIIANVGALSVALGGVVDTVNAMSLLIDTPLSTLATKTDLDNFEPVIVEGPGGTGGATIINNFEESRF
jgi:hypothetical protein